MSVLKLTKIKKKYVPGGTIRPMCLSSVGHINELINYQNILSFIANYFINENDRKTVDENWNKLNHTINFIAWSIYTNLS